MPKRHKNKIIISSLVILGILFVTLGSKDYSTKKYSNEEYIALQEAKLEEFLISIEGIKKANVIITIEEAEIEDNKSVFGSQGDQSIYPKVRGVAIACTNGDNYKVKEKITNVVSRYLGISSNRVKIVAIK
jgi:hypothetical protein